MVVTFFVPELASREALGRVAEVRFSVNTGARAVLRGPFCAGACEYDKQLQLRLS